MPLVALFLLGLCILFETGEQVAYTFSGKLADKKALCIATGVGVHLLKIASWYGVLRIMPLGIATPLMGATYISIPLVSRCLFGEEVNRQRWIGIGIILIGLWLIWGHQQ